MLLSEKLKVPVSFLNLSARSWRDAKNMRLFFRP